MYFYILLDGECAVVKDGKRVQGKYGTIEKGVLFGEDMMLTDERVRTATVVATNGSDRTGTVVLCRLLDSAFVEMMGKEEIGKLRLRMRDIKTVVDILSGV